jgi:hypothetical protein
MNLKGYEWLGDDGKTKYIYTFKYCEIYKIDENANDKELEDFKKWLQENNNKILGVKC